MKRCCEMMRPVLSGCNRYPKINYELSRSGDYPMARQITKETSQVATNMATTRYPSVPRASAIAIRSAAFGMIDISWRVPSTLRSAVTEIPNKRFRRLHTKVTTPPSRTG